MSESASKRKAARLGLNCYPCDRCGFWHITSSVWYSHEKLRPAPKSRKGKGRNRSNDKRPDGRRQK